MMANQGDAAKLAQAQDTMETLMEISNLLNTGLDADTLAVCVKLCESGVNPAALAQVIRELRRESTALKSGDEDSAV